MLELPVTTGFCGWLRGAGPVLYPLAASPAGRRMRMGGILARSRALERIRLSPEGCSGADMVRLLRALHGAGRRLFTLTYHSPSLEPGHTPYVRSRDDLEALLGAIDQACRFFRDELGGVFLSSTRMREAMLGHHA